MTEIIALQGDGLTSEMVFSHEEIVNGEPHVHFIHEHCEASCQVRIPHQHWVDIGMPRKLAVILVSSETLEDFLLGGDGGFEI